MDCSSTMNAIYRCFGIILPRNTGSMAQTGTQIVSLEGMTQEEKLEKMRTENDALETSINTSIDLNEIYEIATKELGMVYAKKDQVLLYDKTESEYVRQYEDIPEH